MNEDDSQLYREVLLQHARHPRNAGRLEQPSHIARVVNPLCGDELELTVSANKGVIYDVRFLVRGCIIVQAAASMISELIPNQALEDALSFGETFRHVLSNADEDVPDVLSSLAPLLTVRTHRSRIRCATLPWEAFRDLQPAQIGGPVP